MSSTSSGGNGGDGKPFAITGEEVYYGGGGGGGGEYSKKDSTTAGASSGGKGGGGRGGQKSADAGTEVAESGKAGTGGGGGGGSNETGLYKGGDGGSGIVIFRYAVQGTGQGMMTPAVALESLDRAANGLTMVGYRVAWAGDGYDYADVLAVWGTRKGELDHTNALSSATGVIGRGAGTFTLPDQTRTVYVRLLATNAVASALSPEIETIPFVNPAAPEATVSVTGTTTTSATFAANVTGLGEDATSVSGVFQVCADEDFEDGTYLTFLAGGTLAEAGTLTGTASGLTFNTAYFVRALLTNDVPASFETDPVEFRTKVPGAPNGSVVTDLTQVANPPAECAPPVATDTTITAWGYLFSPGSGGVTYADLRLEASTDANFQTVAAYTATETGVTERGYRSFTLTGLEPETAYYLRLRSENDGHVVKSSDVVGPFTTLPRPTVITVW